ncbi:hypothetical protein T492DRAFT_839700 [Pavlovales sp. CCMP2436]|nr:hypothetical protein T492DRAFT_839700 [Pavlovales sp. CCMP2436]
MAFLLAVQPFLIPVFAVTLLVVVAAVQTLTEMEHSAQVGRAYTEQRRRENYASAMAEEAWRTAAAWTFYSDERHSINERRSINDYGSSSSTKKAQWALTNRCNAIRVLTRACGRPTASTARFRPRANAVPVERIDGAPGCDLKPNKGMHRTVEVM